MPRAKFIRDEAQLLDALRENPTRRAIVLRPRSKRIGDCYAVVEFPADDLTGDGQFIAWIDGPGSASDLLHRAYQADLTADDDAFARLPLRRGASVPFYPSYVLSDHPCARKEAGGDTPPYGDEDCDHV